MSLGRLTRQELGWLLAHEARGAAQTLRAEVKELRAVSALDDEDRVSSLPGELSLEALDNAIDVLSQLQPSARARRRGRLDLAAIVYELAPNWSVMLEPGAGTEVFGDEEEFRRLLQVLLTQSGEGTLGANARALELRREGDWVRLSTPLGPDTAAAGEMERRWLARMALRLGGRYELHGKHQSLILPAETEDRLELQALRAELHEAQELGETYARELAQILAEPTLQPSADATVRGAAQREALQQTAFAMQHDPVRAQALLNIFSDLQLQSVGAPQSVELGELLNAALHSVAALPNELKPQFVLELQPVTVLAERVALQALLSALLLRAASVAPSDARVVVRCFLAPPSAKSAEARSARVELQIPKAPAGPHFDERGRPHESVRAFAALCSSLLAERLAPRIETGDSPTELALQLTLRGAASVSSQKIEH